jgi:hypothetical protein
MKLETGDIIFTAKGSLVVKFMRLFQKDPVFWGHVLIVKDSETAWEASTRLKETNIEWKLAREPSWKIIRNRHLGESHKEIMREVAPKLLGRPYGAFRIVLQILDHVFKTDWFTRRVNYKHLQVCSSYVAWIYWLSCKHRFNKVEWQSCEPDDIEDDQLSNPHIWKVIATHGKQRSI